MMDEDISEFIEVKIHFESVSGVLRMYYYTVDTAQELEDKFREKYPEHCI